MLQKGTSFLFQVMLLVAKRRMRLAATGRSDLPLPPAPPPHPGYAPNAALHAIKRHAQEFVAPKARAVRWLIILKLLCNLNDCIDGIIHF